MSDKLIKVKLFLKSGQTVEFQTANLKARESGALTWDEPDKAKTKLMALDRTQIAAVTYE